jgi:hypothetical protein
MAQGPGGGRGFGDGFMGHFGGPEQKVVTGSPYSANETRTTIQTLSNGNQITRSQQASIARDSQGRISNVSTVTPPAKSGRAPYTISTIIDPVGGSRYRLDSSPMVATQAALPAARATTRPTRREPQSNPDLTTIDLGTQMINGVQATGKQTTMTIPAGAVGNAQAMSLVRITWTSVNLGIPVSIKTSDPRFGTTDVELTNITQSEPNGALFVVPGGYTTKTGGGPERRGGPGGGRMMRPGPDQQ